MKIKKEEDLYPTGFCGTPCGSKDENQIIFKNKNR
jgi:hypothetical protein